MPTAEGILAGLGAIANEWRFLAILWHVYLAILVFGLVMGVRPARRLAGVLLALPVASVSALAWIHGNPFNGTFFALASSVLLVIACRVPRGNVVPESGWLFVLAGMMIGFGWVYPHFLAASGPIEYLYAAPVGLVPCPTLSVVIGGTLLLGGLGTRLWCFVLAGLGLFYGVFGAVYLGVAIDWILAVGAVLTAYVGFSSRMIGEGGEA